MLPPFGENAHAGLGGLLPFVAMHKIWLQLALHRAGYEACKSLMSKGATLIMASRSEQMASE